MQPDFESERRHEAAFLAAMQAASLQGDGMVDSWLEPGLNPFEPRDAVAIREGNTVFAWEGPANRLVRAVCPPAIVMEITL